jgi:hypothetical protein
MAQELKEQVSARSPSTVRSAVAGVTAATVGIGLIPVIDAADLNPWYVVAVTIFAFAIVILAEKTPNTSTARPGFLEHLVASVNSSALVVTVFVLGAAAFTLVNWIVQGTNASFDTRWNAGSWATNVSIVVCLLLLVAVVRENAREQTARLYPGVAGLLSRYHDVITVRRRDLLKCALWFLGYIVGVGVLLATELEEEWALLFLVYLMLFNAGSSVDLPSEPEFRTPEKAINHLVQAFTAAGYGVVPYPRTGIAAVDPLLVEIDLFVHKGDKALAIEVKRFESGDGHAIPWTAGTAVVAAARALAEVELPSSVEKVNPALVLLGVEPDESLRKFAHDSQIPLVQIQGQSKRVDVIGALPGIDLDEVGHLYLKMSEDN